MRIKYKGIKVLLHIDAYRLKDGKQLEAIGVEDYINEPSCVTVIEWANRVKNIFSTACILGTGTLIGRACLDFWINHFGNQN